MLDWEIGFDWEDDVRRHLFWLVKTLLWSHSWHLSTLFCLFHHIQSEYKLSGKGNTSWHHLLPKLVNCCVTASIFCSKLDPNFLDHKLTESLMIRWTVDDNTGIARHDSNHFYLYLTCFGNMRNDLESASSVEKHSSGSSITTPATMCSAG